jgi:uncharacterized protein
MDCPVCGARLIEIERSGVMVDICPSCKGVWLDRGEIDKIIEVESKGTNVVSPTRARGDGRAPERRDHDDHDDHDHDNQRHDDYRSSDQTSGGQKKRRSSLLSDLLGGLGGE